MRRVEISIILMSLLVGMLVFASGVKLGKAAGAVYIRADGSVDPPTASLSTFDNVTYTLTGSIYDSSARYECSAYRDCTLL